MGAPGIVAAVFAMLCWGVVGAVSAVNLTKRKGFPHLLMVIGAGCNFLALVFMIIPTVATGVIAVIFAVLGAPAFAAGFVLLNMKVWQDEKKVAAPAPPKQA